MTDPVSANEEVIGDISELKKGIDGQVDTFKWEAAYRELGQSQAGQMRRAKLLRNGGDKSRDGSVGSFESAAGPAVNPAVQPEGFARVDRDISERKRMEAALQAAHDELEKRVAGRTDELARVNDALRTEIVEYKRIETALQAAYTELEQRAANRADELVRVGDELRTEITERKRTEAVLQQAHDELERRVADRNEDLIRVTDELRTEINERKQIEAALQQAHDELEQRVADRTDELVRMNDVSQTEIAEGKRREAALQQAHDELERSAADRTNELMLVSDGLRTEITELKKAEEELQHTLDNFHKMVGTTIQVMGSAVEIKDPHTAGHQTRSTVLARNIARMMGLSRDQINTVRMACSIHDIGKLSIPSELLSKPGKLSEIECPLVKEHAKRGYEILKEIEFPWPLADIVHQHHERMDGSGYPRNLKGDDICVEARIMAVADVVEAMCSHRPYRPALGIEAALEEIERNRGSLYDSTVVDACLQLFRDKGFQFAEA